MWLVDANVYLSPYCVVYSGIILALKKTDEVASGARNDKRLSHCSGNVRGFERCDVRRFRDVLLQIPTPISPFLGDGWMWCHECVALYIQLCVAMPGTAATASDRAMYYHDAGFRVFKGTRRCDVVGALVRKSNIEHCGT